MVFGESVAAIPAAAADVFAGAPPMPDRLAVEVGELKKQLESMRQAITRSTFAPAQWISSSPDASDAYAVLAASGVSSGLAREIVQSAESRVARPRATFPRMQQALDPAAFQHALIEELESRITVQATLGSGDSRPRVVALVGPPGSGKTTTLVKLAVNYGLASRRPVLLLSMDTYRVAAAEQLRAYASILGVHFHVLDTVAALAQAIEENRGKELIFIDTPGLSSADLDNGLDLARFLSTRPDVDTQLVLTASMKPTDLARVTDSFEVFRPQRMIFTRLDETASFGSIFNEAARTGKALSFFTAGQRIPEDLETATRQRLVQLVLSGKPSQELSAA